MSLLKIQEAFVEKLQSVYEAEEAKNIFILVMEHLTGINMRSTPAAKFSPDGCFIKLFGEIEERLLTCEPVQYILNEAWFYDAPFYVNKNVLIPRPETEELVDRVIKDYQEKASAVLLDIGTGSGCIPITLKRKLPRAEVYSCDISAAALEVAQKNARKHKAAVTFLELDFLDPGQWTQLPRVHAMISNPPYIPESDKAKMQDNVLRHEPHQALFVADAQPLIFYDALAKAGKELLQPGGCIYAEIYEGLGPETLRLFETYGYQATLKKDMQLKDRFIEAQQIS